MFGLLGDITMSLVPSSKGKSANEPALSVRVKLLPPSFEVIDAVWRILATGQRVVAGLSGAVRAPRDSRRR